MAAAPPGISIRLATANDLSKLAYLIEAAFVEYKSAYTDEAFAATAPTSDQLAQRLADGPIWVATAPGSVLVVDSSVFVQS